LVGDRGMISQARISEDIKPAGLDWITALRAPAIKALLDGGALQMSLFDDRDVAGITSPEFPSERLIVCRNRALAAERARKRKDLLAATERDLARIAAAVARKRQPLRGKAEIGMPRFSGDQARQAVENDAEDRLIGGARRQVDLDLLFQFDYAGGDLDEAQPQSVELHNTPGRAFGHQPAHRPEEPVGTGVKKKAELVGSGLMAGGVVRGQVVLPRLDMVLGLAPGATQPFIELLGAAALQIW
jgi:hypothetical protein